MITVRTSKKFAQSWIPLKTSYSTVISNVAKKAVWFNDLSTMWKEVNMERTRFMGLQKQAKIETI